VCFGLRHRLAASLDGEETLKNMVFVEQLKGYRMKPEWTGSVELFGRKLQNTNYLEISRKITYIDRVKKVSYS